MVAGRYDEALQVLSDSVAPAAEGYTLLDSMAAQEGGTEEAVRLSEFAVTA